MKNIINENNKGQFHGYQEFYFVGNIWVKCFYNNNIIVDYSECCSFTGELKNKVFYL